MRSGGTLVASLVSKHYGARVVLHDVSLTIPAESRTGVVGPNGVGKSTLLRILAGLEAPDAGTVARVPESLSTGYLPQELDARAGETLLDYLARRTGVAAAESDMDVLAARLDGDPSLAEPYTAALDRFLALGGDDLESRARAVCRDVGLAADRLHRPVGALSGGQAARAALAAILLARFDVLLLDEPTNDLDFAGLELLESFLDETSAAVAVVSHDRALLERTVGRIVELDESSGRTREYAGGWTAYEQERTRARRAQYEAFGHYVDKRERLEEQLRTRRRWIERATTQRRKKKTRDVAGNFERKLKRLERVEKPFEPWELRLTLDAGERAGDVVARLDGAVVDRGDFRLGPIDVEIRRRDRVVVVGPNGSGKTTVLLALLGRLPLAAGSRSVGTGVVLGELEQGRDAFGGDELLLETFVNATGTKSEQARTLLAKFGLDAEDVLRPAASLSPGERTRAALASFAARSVNFLVLDEPTNHLDLPAIEELEEALERFAGTVVAVSHDRRFLERFRPTREVEIQRSKTYERTALNGR